MNYLELQGLHLKVISESDITINTLVEDLNISGNDLQNFPKSLKNLTRLTHINADSNQISSLETLTEIPSLLKLDLCRNYIVEIPTCLSTLTKLYQLSLFANKIRTLPYTLGSLKELNLGSNEITKIPLGCNFSLLTHLDLSQNNLSQIEGLTGLNNLIYINLECNKITSLPFVGCLSKLESINISNNNIEVIPESITQLTCLSFFNAASNPIKTLPTGFFKLKSLRFISLTNTLVDSFNEPLDNLIKLQTLLMNDIKLSEMPNGICQIHEMRDLNLSNNKISEIDHLPLSTDSFNVSNNIINTFNPEGTPQIGNIYLKNNDFDHFPLKLMEITNLQLCDISKNKIITIPDIPLELKYLKSIDVSFNGLTSIPPIFDHCSRLTKLNASYNQLTSFPPSRSLQHIQVLLLSGNQISQIPNDVSTLTQLTLLHLANNSFIDFPTILSKLPKLQRLSLSMNSLSNFPEFTNGALISLDISCNRLTSIKFPYTTNLKRLKLSHNALGEIPNTRPPLPSLQILDLSSNGLTNFVLHTNEFPSLSVLDLSCNNLSVSPNIGQRKFALRLDGNPNWQATQYPFLPNFLKLEEFSTIPPSFSFCSKCSNRVEMQDSIICIPNFTAPDFFLFAAIDGHLGSVVSNTFATKFPQILYNFLKTQNIKTAFFQAFKEMQNQLKEAKVTDGAVVTVTFLTPSHIYVAQCGDCRAIYITEKKVTQLCEEHTPSNPQEFKRIKECGGYTERGRVFGEYIVSRSIGDINLKPVISDLPEFVVCDRTENEQFLIVASDGLWDQVSNNDIVSLLNKKKSSRTAELSALLCDVAFVSGSTDNICVLVCKLN
ncbi:leucine rich repeat / protein phosphatase 2C domain containing protein [Entamoeba histolytica HM-1:IMSS-B]|uniref:Leucine rich repeat / protein phosphatase 2C domain containing protein n=6 Tax=Entamoeba histolytica TaxID=5759 RepID=C4M7G7_ENTH1|nr:leucine rich repeat / protein phosphatase 2C domain containing protein [Entamoeba histolytica HM-1:IMSS]EMD45538.1 leucinerich repeat-containing protein precursor [Entamoeba histolytica KU27]EMH74001.1 leucine rich repeat / protein phosphatase 2C domain containing protein [Entamoeba histolytica HM-1:IMSS-B]EMS13016.1 leucine-rich repeat-containing protein 33 precursor, putative [Entamoeba histolytica HM-3:IMSS]ENY60899.1 leucine-rich repeat-containing protein 33 precursor [Entamoeba histolyt|eukprot:XP_649701.1 leucine rich repeat / protein phosphatase 2C domain containing protein [Entamoeba histolytica HM-1:IMSS]